MRVKEKLKYRCLWILSVLCLSLFFRGPAGVQAFENTLTLSYSGGSAYYGAQLAGQNERRVYTALVSQSRNGKIFQADSQSHAITVNLAETVSLSGSQTQLNDLYNGLGRALDAFLFDYSENYWIRGYQCIPIVKLSPSRITGFKIWFKDAYSGIRSDKSEADKALKKLYAQVSGKNRYETIKDAYEEINRLVEYPPDSEVNEIPYHTIVSGLLGKYGHKGVCESYARLFQLVCQKKGIACVLVMGGSQVLNGEVYTDHIWNAVQMDDGKWYLVDCTWGDTGGGAGNTVYLLAGSSTSGLTGRTVGQEHMPVGRFTSMKYKPFSTPKISTNAYVAGSSQAKALQKVTLGRSSLKVTKGSTAALTAKVTPSTFPADELNWKSSDSKVAAVTVMGSAGKAYITGKAAGTATITVSWRQKVVASCKVTVQNAKTAVKYKIRLNAAVLPLQLKKSTTALQITSFSSGDSLKEWVSSDPGVVKVDKRTGRLTARKLGTAEITAVSQKGARASCRVTVQKSQVATKKLSLKKTSVVLKKGKNMTVKVIRTPLTATDKLSLRTSDPKIVAVNAKGKITAKKKGTATVTIRSASGKTVKLKVKVK